MLDLAREVIARCHTLATHSEDPSCLTRTFLSPPMHAVHRELGQWMHDAGLSAVSTDAAGNLHGKRQSSTGKLLIIASHLDTVPRAGMFDGPLGVLIGVALAKLRPSANIEVIGFSEEEGVRFGFPFFGSLAWTDDPSVPGLLDRKDRDGVTVAEAIRAYGLDPTPQFAPLPAPAAYLEFHIEQGPVLESLNLPLAVVDTIVGQSRYEVRFTGQANHAGTTPMHLRKDALAAAAHWIVAVEQAAQSTEGLVATVGRIEVTPGAGNVIPGEAILSLDLRHASNDTRRSAADRILREAHRIATSRGLHFTAELRLDQDAVDMDPDLIRRLEWAAGGHAVHHMNSGAGHDAMIAARRMPSAMLFLRSPGGISHHPDETVLIEDVAAALAAGDRFLENWDSDSADA